MSEGCAKKVAIIGARGIGRHHAKWWALEGADVCAFAGTSPESVDATTGKLKELFAFTGKGYANASEMLEQEKPDIVDVCTPPPCHAEHVGLALEAGCDVLCEKPLVFDAAIPREQLLAQARELMEAAKAKGKRLGVCTQYAAGGLSFQRIWEQDRPGEIVTEYCGHLESPAKNRPPDPARVWVDLSPHPISVLLKLAPGAEVRWDTLETTFEGYAAEAEFEMVRPSGPPLHCRLITRNATESPLNVRCFHYDEYIFRVEGQNDSQGVYCARIETPGGNHVEDDMMRVLIRDFLQGGSMTGPEESIRNLDIMLRVLESTQD